MSEWLDAGGPWLPGMLVLIPSGDPRAPTYPWRIVCVDSWGIQAWDETMRTAVRWRKCDDGWRSWRLDIDLDNDGGSWAPSAITLNFPPPAWTLAETDGPTLGACEEHLRMLYGNDRCCLTPLSRGRWAFIVPSPLRPVPRHVGSTRMEAMAAALVAGRVR